MPTFQVGDQPTLFADSVGTRAGALQRLPSADLASGWLNVEGAGGRIAAYLWQVALSGQGNGEG